jgi:hypothetical protein
MKKILILTFILIAAVFFAHDANAQERTTDRVWASPNASVAQTIGLTEVLLTYGRPAVRGRALFGDLVPYGEVWRTGANEATAIVFSDNVFIEGEPLAEGTYSLYTIPGINEWTIIINNKLSWGTQYDSSEDVLRINVQPDESFHVEQMMFYFENVTENSGHLVLHWGEVKVPVSIQIAE